MSDDETTVTGAQAPETETDDSAPAHRSRGPALNRVELLGRLTADPEFRYSPSGTGVAGLRLATNEREEPMYHSLTAFGKQAEFAGQYLRTGRLIYVQGRLSTQSYFDRETGEKKYSTKVLVNDIQVLDRPRQEGQTVEAAETRTIQEEPASPSPAPRPAQARHTTAAAMGFQHQAVVREP